MLRVVHDVRGQRVEREEVRYSFLLLAVDRFSGAHHVGVNDLISWQEVMLHLLISVVELDHEFAE